MTEKQAKQLMKKYQESTITREEEKLLEAFDTYLLSQNEDSIYQNDSHKRNIKYSIEQNIYGKAPHFNLGWLKIAATIALFISMGTLGYYTLNHKDEQKEKVVAEVIRTTDWGQKLDITLEDGTKIRLNSGSSIKFPEHFNDSVRQVELTGEAFFDVAKNPHKPFIIKSGALNTTVLGTSFNINAYQESQEIAVTVATGKVKVASQNNETFLLPNEQGVFNKSSNNISKKEIDNTEFLEWKDGIMRFNNTTLADASIKLSRWYNVKFEFEAEAIKQCKFTGKFKNENLQTILQGLVFIKEGLSYKLTGDNTIILTGKCTN